MALFNLISGFIDGLRPEPILSVSEWSDRNRFLSSIASAEPGRWRTSRTPYLKEIMDKLSSDDPTQDVIVMKGAQLGFTEMGYNFVGYVIDNCPAPTLYVLPTEDICKTNSKTRFDPMVEASPALQKKLPARKTRSADNTTLMKQFPGGSLKFSGANSASSLRNMPIRFLVLDEVDAYPKDLDGEGSPVKLAEKRTSTFGKKKIYKLSTPTVKGASVIEDEFNDSDKRYYYVPCPECGTEQKLEFGQLRYDVDDYDNTTYECKHCNHQIEERFKTKMLESGRWVAEAPEKSSYKKAGYHISSLYSPYGWESWGNLCEQFEGAQGDSVKTKTFVNTALGETYQESGDSPEFESLYDRRETYKIGTCPEDVCVLTCGVDIQKDRVELEVVGWTKDKSTYSIDYRVINGDTTSREVYDNLAMVLDETFPHALGGSMKITIMAVDSGYNTSKVYDFCNRFTGIRVIPVKGKDELGGQILVRPPKTINYVNNGRSLGTKVYNVNTHLIKSEIYDNLKRKVDEGGVYPAGYCHFPEYSIEYFKMLTAEELRSKINKKGYQVMEWHKIRDRNETLDLRVYARAAANVIGIDFFNEDHFKSYQDQRITNGSTAPKKKKPKPKSDFW